MNRQIVVCISMIVVLLALNGCQVKSVSGADIVTNILNADQENISYYLESRYEDLENDSFVMKEWRLQDGRLRREVIVKDEPQYTMVNNGEEFKLIDYIEQEVISIDSPETISAMSQSPRDTMIEMLESMYEYYDITVAESTRLVGRDVFALELTGKESSMDNMSVWVDKENWIMLKTVTEFAGELMVTEPVAFELNPKVTNEFFTIDQPDGFEEVVMDNDVIEGESLTIEEANERLQGNMLIPNEDFVLKEIIDITTKSSQEERVELSFSFVKEDGTPAFSYSVFKTEEPLEAFFGNEEEVVIRGNNAFVLWDESTEMVVWEEEGMRYVFLADSSMKKEEAIEVIEGMRRSKT